MTYISFNNNKSAAASFAAEEYLLKNPLFQDEYFMFWNTVPTLMIGRFQNTIEEINLDFAKHKKMDVIRRNSGGGTIYTDENTWQFSFITWKENNQVKDFREFTKPVIQALENLGVAATFSGRNDLLLGDKKFSGNAQFSYKNRFLHHGSILFNAHIEDLVKSISPDNQKIISKGIKSVKERVVNLKKFLKNSQMTTKDFKNEMLKFLKKDMPILEFSEKDMQEILKIQEKKFNTWDWNFGKSPEFSISKSQKFTGGKVEVLLNVKNGFIIDCRFNGDFFFNGDIDKFQQKFIGLKYNANDVAAVLHHSENYFQSIDVDKILELFC
ncbi:MAG: lipoate--protein ligase [Bacteroidales bacterium]|nr:lipoate--protein ligase [Bacteroidales bacterium]